METQKDCLIGRDAICSYAGRSWKIIFEWIQQHGFPAKVISGKWESSKALIDEWRRRQIQA